jgi:hypothetical protein
MHLTAEFGIAGDDNDRSRCEAGQCLQSDDAGQRPLSDPYHNIHTPNVLAADTDARRALEARQFRAVQQGQKADYA